MRILGGAATGRGGMWQRAVATSRMSISTPSLMFRTTELPWYQSTSPAMAILFFLRDSISLFCLTQGEY